MAYGPVNGPTRLVVAFAFGMSVLARYPGFLEMEIITRAFTYQLLFLVSQARYSGAICCGHNSAVHVYTHTQRERHEHTCTHACAYIYICIYMYICIYRHIT